MIDQNMESNLRGFFCSNFAFVSGNLGDSSCIAWHPSMHFTYNFEVPRHVKELHPPLRLYQPDHGMFSIWVDFCTYHFMTKLLFKNSLPSNVLPLEFAKVLTTFHDLSKKSNPFHIQQIKHFSKTQYPDSSAKITYTVGTVILISFSLHCQKKMKIQIV